MCTAFRFYNYFGRNYDYEYSYDETISIVPRNYNLKFKSISDISNHYAFMGISHIEDGYPLFYDAINEYGLGCALLNFKGNAYYNNNITNKINITVYELILYILSTCKSVFDVLDIINDINFINIKFNDKLELPDIHFFICDKYRSIVIEPSKEGINVYNNDIDVLTNNPNYKIQLFMLNNYIGLSNENPRNTFSFDYNFDLYSRGMGSIGLPGDFSSCSRFIRCAFILKNSILNVSSINNISQVFHILDLVKQPLGCVKVGDLYEYSIYSICYDLDKISIYYKRYFSLDILNISLFDYDLDSNRLIVIS